MKAKQLMEWAEGLMHQADGDSRSTAEKALAWAKNKAERLRSSDRISAVRTLATSNSSSAAVPEQFDADIDMLATRTGIINLRTGELREPRRGTSRPR